MLQCALCNSLTLKASPIAIVAQMWHTTCRPGALLCHELSSAIRKLWCSYCFARAAPGADDFVGVPVVGPEQHEPPSTRMSAGITRAEDTAIVQTPHITRNRQAHRSRHLPLALEPKHVSDRKTLRIHFALEYPEGAAAYSSGAPLRTSRPEAEIGGAAEPSPWGIKAGSGRPEISSTAAAATGCAYGKATQHELPSRQTTTPRLRRLGWSSHWHKSSRLQADSKAATLRQIRRPAQPCTIFDGKLVL